MSDGQGETPIDDIDTALPWAGIEDAPAAETPAISEEASHVDVPADDADLVSLQLDETPDEEVTLVLTRDEAIPVETEGSISEPAPAADIVVPPLSESIEVTRAEPPAEAASVGDAQVLEVTPDAMPSAEIPASLDDRAAEIEPIPSADESTVTPHAPVADEVEVSPVAPLISDNLMVSEGVSVDSPVQEVTPSPDPIVAEAHPVVDFFERGEIEALHAPLDIVEPAVSVEPVTATAPEVIQAIPTPAVIAQASPETNDDFAILAPQSPAPVEQFIPVVSVVAEPEAEEVDEPDLDPVPEEEAELELVSAGAPVDEGGAGAWSIAALCLGVAVIACAVLIPQTDFNRRLVYEREKLRRDLASIEQQTKVNDEFLQRVSSDPSLAERLAQRQMKIIRKGTKVLELQDDPPEEMSPYQLVAVPPPAPLPAYEPKRGMIANVCYGVRSRLYLMGAGLMLMAAGLVFGAGPTRE